MAIYGIATTNDGMPVTGPDLEAMRSCLAPHKAPADSVVLPRVGVGSVAVAPQAAFYSCEHLLVACDSDLYHPVISNEPSAAEAIARLYLSEGPLFLHKLKGAFALAIWDIRTRTLMLAVDRFGIKRLCYGQTDSEIIFATRPSAIFASNRVQKNVDLSAITEYLVYNVVPIPRTAFEGIARVAPGEYVLWTEKVATKTRYWDMRYPENDHRSNHALSEELLSRMEAAVQVTSADLNLSTTGCFLSGGTDSSSILGLLTRLYSAPVNAFSIGFSEDRFNELQYAHLAAKHFRAHLFEDKLGPIEARNVVDKIVSTYDEPFGNSSAIPTYWCAKLARERGMEVLLAGDGGDELFGGNERYREEQIFDFYQRIPSPARRWLIEPALFGSSLTVGPFGKAKNYIRRCNTGNPDRYFRWRLLRRFSPDLVLGSHMPFRNGHSDLLSAARLHYRTAPASTELNRLLYVDVKMTLGDDDLPKVTQTAEMAGLRVRFPYLDHELAEFSGRLPASLKVRLLEKRYLFKRATRNLLPEAILKKKKHGFGLPIGFWLKSDPHWHAWAKEILYDPRTYQRGYFRREFVEQLFSDMQQDETPYFGDLLWVFLVLELWHRQHVEVVACCA
jgi:asparagine synthase (glutamine-hydrolysing)